MKARQGDYQVFFQLGSEDRVQKYRKELQKLGYFTGVQILCAGCNRPLQRVMYGKYRYVCDRCGVITKVNKK